MGVLASRVPLPQSSFEIKKTCPGTRTVIVEGRERLTNSYFFPMVYNILLHLHILGRLSKMWPVETPSRWLLYPCDVSQHPSSTASLSGITRCSRLILCPPCPNLGMSHFSKELGIMHLVLRVLQDLLQRL